MCNRFRSIREWSEIPRDLYSGPRLNFEFNPNVAPSEIAPILLAGEGGVSKAVLARFGIDRMNRPGNSLKNARTDGMRGGQFRTHLRERRCVVPAAGFYEWREEGGKQPYYFERKDGRPLMIAGIWDIAEYKGDRREAFALLTDDENDMIQPYHDRMPMVLADDEVAPWLDLETPQELDRDQKLDLSLFSVRPMNRAMNSSRQKDLSVIDPAASPRPDLSGQNAKAD